MLLIIPFLLIAKVKKNIVSTIGISLLKNREIPIYLSRPHFYKPALAHTHRNTKKRALTNLQMRQDALINSSRRFYQNIKRFFKKLLMFLKMLCQVFRYLFFLLVILNSIGLHYLCTTKRNIHSLHKRKRWKTSTLP